MVHVVHHKPTIKLQYCSGNLSFNKMYVSSSVDEHFTCQGHTQVHGQRELFDLPFIDRLDQTALIFFPWTPSFNYCVLSQAIVRGYTACLRVKALLRRNSYWKLQKAFICSCNPMHSLMAILFCSSTIKSQSLQSSSVPT